jgi:hypothetical protein
MNLCRFCKALVSLAIVLPMFTVAACGDDSSDPAPAGEGTASSVLGVYENANDGMSIELLADNRAILTEEGSSTEHAWETDGADKVVIHAQDGVNLVFTVNSEGNLSDGYGGIYIRK